MQDLARYREALRWLKCLVVIPTYNNEGTIVEVVAAVRRYADEVLVVNDGSTDRTPERIAALEGIRCISYPKNRGKGHALRLALQYAADEGFDYALTLDADGQHYAEDILRFVERIEEIPGSLLIGARNLTAENMPSKNTFANRFSNFWYRVETGQRLEDTQSGYRLYPVQKLRNIRLLTSRYEFEVEIIVRAAWRGVRVENIPIQVYYPPEGERVSHFRPLQDFTRISLLNTVLVLYALLAYYPWRFVRALTRENIRHFFEREVLRSPESNLRMALSIGWGVFCGIIPLWGYQMVFALATAHLLRLNRVVAVVCSNISIPPMIPLILYGSVVMGAWVLGLENGFSFQRISFEEIAQSLTQYVVGSIALALLAGVVVTIVAWFVMTLCRRGGAHE